MYGAAVGSTFARFCVAAVAVAIATTAYALDEKQEKALVRALERITKLAERVARKESYKRTQLEFHAIRTDLLRLPKDEPRVKEALAKLDELEATAQGKPQPAPNPDGSGSAGSGSATGSDSAGSGSGSAAGSGIDSAGSGSTGMGSAAAADHPMTRKIRGLLSFMAGLKNRTTKEDPDAVNDATMERLKSDVAEIVPHEGPQVAELEARHAELVAHRAACKATRDARRELLTQAKTLARQLSGYPHIDGDQPAEVDRYLEDMAQRRKRAAEGAALAAKILADDPDLPKAKVFSELEGTNTLAYLNRYGAILEAENDKLSEMRWKRGQQGLETVRAAAGSGGARPDGQRAIEALNALKRMQPTRAADCDEMIATIEGLMAKGDAAMEAARLERQKAHRFPGSLMPAPAVDALRDAFKTTGSAQGYDDFLKFAVTKDAWQLVEEWVRDGDKMVFQRYEWLYVHAAYPHADEAGIVMDVEYELRRTPGATEFRIYRRTGSWRMLAENLEK